MVSNYLKVATRNLYRHKGFTFINIAGLAVGIACCLLLLVYLQYETSFDKFHKEYPQIYRVLTKNFTKFLDGDYIDFTPTPLAATMRQEMPEVVSATRFSGDSRTTLRREGNEYWTTHLWADSTFTDIFSFPVYRGDLQRALSRPYSMALTRSAARKVFGTDDAIGKIARFGTVFDLQVEAVLEDLPETSDLQFDCLISMATRREYWKEDVGVAGSAIYTGKSSPWSTLSGNTYLKLRQGVDAKRFEEKLNALTSTKYPKEMGVAFKVQPMTDIHLKGNPSGEVRAHGDIRYVYLLSAIAVLILLIAAFNYMNLSTARASTRAREIGLRKVLGGTRTALAGQFLGESVLTTGAAVVLGVLLAEFALPVFNSLVELKLQFNLLHNHVMQCGIVAIVFVVGILAGAYPAWFLSSIHVQKTVRGMTTTNPRGATFMRGALVVVQNVIAIVLIVCTIVMFRQLNYLKSKDLGFDTAKIAVVPVKDFRTLKGLESLRREIAQFPGVADVTWSESVPFEGCSGASGCWWEGKQVSDPQLYINTDSIRSNFVDLYGIQFAEGHGFSDSVQAENRNKYIINETTMRAIGWTTAVGRSFGISQEEKGVIVGVVKDFHYASLRKPIEPLVLLYLSPDSRGNLSIKVTGDNIQAVVDRVRSIWRNYSSFAFEYYTLDDHIGKEFQSERRLVRVLTYSAFFAIVVACLGLFGLAAYGVERRTREIAVRKVFGGPVTAICGSLIRDFVKWVLVANLAAWPIAYLIMQRWLQGYPYRTSLEIGVFIVSGALALLVALLTVGYQTVRAAKANPVDSLRCE